MSLDIFPSEYFDSSMISSMRIGGRGGKERLLAKVIRTEWRKVNDPMYDIELPLMRPPLRVELKKQKDTQWFDSGKYHDLTDAHKNIVLMLINHNYGIIDLVSAIRLGVFIDILLSDSRFEEWGWNQEVLSAGARFKKIYPSLQFKAKVLTRKVIDLYSCEFQTLYNI